MLSCYMNDKQAYVLFLYNKVRRLWERRRTALQVKFEGFMAIRILLICVKIV